MDLLGKHVSHATHGMGVVTLQNSEFLGARFEKDGQERKFPFPYCLNRYITIDTPPKTERMGN